jgi:hypothetical protein
MMMFVISKDDPDYGALTLTERLGKMNNPVYNLILKSITIKHAAPNNLNPPKKKSAIFICLL